MKIFLHLLLTFFTLIFSTNVNAWWYPLNWIAVEYDKSSPWSNCWSSTCETTPHETYCFNSKGWTTQTWDNKPSWDNRSAVDLPSPDSWDTSPIYLDNASDNNNHDWDQQLSSSVAWDWTMYCYYWDKIKFHKSTYELSDYNFTTFWVANWETKDLQIDFQLKTLVDWSESNVRIDNTDDWIESAYFTITFYDNTQLNHFTNSSWSAVEALNTETDNIDDNTHTRTITYNISSSNLSTYTDLNNKFLFKYKFYNSTIWDAINFRDDFVLKTIDYNITFNWWSSYFWRYIYSWNNWWEINDISDPIYLTPLIELTNTWVIFWTWLVEWTSQTWKLTVINNDPSVSTSSEWVYLSMTWSDTHPEVVDYFTWTGKVDDWNYKNIDKDSLVNNFINILSDWAEYILETLFTLVDWDWTIDNIVDLRVREFVEYTIWWKTVTFLAWVINQNNNQNFETLKIYWVTNISDYKQKDILTDQNDLDIQNLAWNITKASLKRDIKRKAINTIKFVDTKNVDDPINNITNDSWDWSNWWKILWNVLYYEVDDWSIIEMWNWADLSITWKKTLIVRWWNLLITENLINDSNNDILWIIVLKWNNWLGGKLYVEPSVDEIDAVIYTDKSIIWYESNYDNWYSWDNEDIIKHEIDWNINNEVLDNQLYIYWSVFSENTIWASRIDPPVCPFWTTIQWIECTTIEAQKYDFNYLRTWLWDNPKYTWDLNTWLNYPIVIKYNSAIQSWPPPLFGE